MALSLSALVLEGAGFDWSAIYMRDAMNAAPYVGGLAVATGAFAQAATRYLADRHVERHSPVVVARTLLLVLGLGNVLVFFAPNAPIALRGIALTGMGTSVLFPLAMSAAAQRPSGGDQRRVARADRFRRLHAGPALARIRGPMLRPPQFRACGRLMSLVLFERSREHRVVEAGTRRKQDRPVLLCAPPSAALPRPT